MTSDMKSNEVSLHPGTSLNVCVGCGDQFVVIEEFADVAIHCGPECEEIHSIFSGEQD
ncbi:hypothetical protein [Lysinibacillus fusiformis]|uniref:hypothetical protein n=1 Tax=Lysinibacillus fusiformis TaxID=28031 RepID=UPI003717A760